MTNHIDLIVDWHIDDADWKFLCFSDIAVKFGKGLYESMTTMVVLQNKYSDWLLKGNVDYITSIISYECNDYLRLEFSDPTELIWFKLANL